MARKVCKFPEKELKNIFPNYGKKEIENAKRITKIERGEGDFILHSLGVWSWEYKKERKKINPKLKSWYKCVKKK